MTDNSAPARIARIVVPTDGSPERKPALVVALELARRLDCHVEMLSVAAPTDLAFRLDLLESQAAGLDANVGTNVVSGHDAERPLGRLANEADTLVCLPSDGRVAFAEAVSGGLSARLLEHAAQPVLVVGPQCRPGLSGRQLAIALDGTDDAEQVVAPAIRLARSLGLVPCLYQVLPAGAKHHIRLPSGSSDMDFLDVPDTAYVKTVAERMTTPDLEVEFEVLHDDNAGKALAHLAAEPDVAILAMASHSLSAVERLLEPSLTHRVIRHASCPVLVTHRSPQTEPAPTLVSGPHVVVGLGGLAEDDAVLDVAMDEALVRGATLEIVHCWGGAWNPPPDGVIGTESEIEAHTRAVAEVNEAVAAVEAAYPDLPVTVWLTRRSPESAVTAAAGAADLVVLGEHHYGLLETVILGHVADFVAVGSTTPIIVVPGSPSAATVPS